MNLGKSLAAVAPSSPLEALQLARDYVADRPSALRLIDLAIDMIANPAPKRSTAEAKRAEILAALRDGPLTRVQIAARIDRSFSFTGALLNDLIGSRSIRRHLDLYILTEQVSP